MRKQAQDLTLLARNPVPLQGQKGWSIWQQLSQLTRQPLLKTSILMVKKTHDLWLRKHGKYQEIQVQGTKHRCSVNYKTAKCECWLTFPCRHRFPSFWARDGNVIQSQPWPSQWDIPGPAEQAVRPGWRGPSSISSLCRQTQCWREEITVFPLYDLHGVAEGFKTASPTDWEAGRLGTPSLRVLFASVTGCESDENKSFPALPLPCLPTCSRSEVVG